MHKLAVFLSILVAVLATSSKTSRLVTSNWFFTPSLYKEITQNQKENFMFSPLSLELALLLLDAGAIGNTNRNIKSALYLDLDSDAALAQEVELLISTLTRRSSYSFNIANGIFYQNYIPLKSSYRQTAVNNYRAKVQGINFSQQFAAANAINTWVEQQTQNKIQNLINPYSLSKDTRLILANALYFKGNWTFGFPLKQTRQKVNFYKTSKDVIYVDMMVLQGKFLEYSSCKDLEAQILKLPIRGDNAAMVIILPDDIDGLKKLEKNPEKLFISRNLTTVPISLTLPKFNIESTFNLNPILKKLGFESIFDVSLADFSGIAGVKGDLTVSDVTQKTYIQVSEGGIEAAAATEIDVSRMSSGVDFPETKLFHVDHPFIFYIEVDNLIVFVGKVEAPRQKIE